MGPEKERYGSITVLMPCKDQKQEFLTDAIDSVINQSSPDWLLFAIIDSDTPEAVKNTINRYLKDGRIKILASESDSLAGALNAGIKNASTEFVCILLSDDRFDETAVEVLKSYIRKYPETDFFYSSRRIIDAQGKPASDIMPSKKRFTTDYFKKHGSPVKHLLCWRREKGLAAGGFDEELTLHGCDDFDFPWSMADKGAKFKNIDECLYYYREYKGSPRLTTDVPVSRQVEVLQKMFKKHGVPEPETEDYIKNAIKGYLVQENIFGCEFKGDIEDVARISYFRQIGEDKKEEFISRGYKERHFIPHRAYYLQKSGPDEFQLAKKMCGINEPNKLWEFILYAERHYIDEFPKELFFDKDIIWHQQHFGKAGHIVFAYMAVDGDILYGLNYVSDIFQRISRLREHKTRVEKKFEGWQHMLLNSIMNFAIENNIKKIYSPTADLAMANTDPKRNVQRELFERVYDRAAQEHFQAEKKGEWWVVDVEKHRDKAVIAEKKYGIEGFNKTICLLHDIEGGLGHIDADPGFARLVEQEYMKNIDEILSIEKEMGIRATYNITGLLFNELKEKIEKDGHCIAFHSYDHKIHKAPICKRIIKTLTSDLYVEQFDKLRSLDYRVRGFRPPMSKITDDMADKKLCYYNFDWLASSPGSLGVRFPKMQNRIVKIPVLFDDFDMYKDKTSYQTWEEKALDTIKNNYFAAFGLHDCYAQYWLPHYRRFLEKIKAMGDLKTLDQVADKVILGNAK